MALNVLSKLGIIIGVVTLLASLLIILAEIPRIKSVFTSDDSDIIFPTSYRVQRVGVLILVVLAGVLSGLLILGIVKRRHLLLAPWLVIGFLLSVYISSTAIYETVVSTYFHWDNYASIVILIGVAIIVLYPVCHLFTEIRSGNAAVGNPKESQSSYVHNIQTAFDKVSQKSIV